MEGITVAEINKLQEENKELKEQLEWKSIKLNMYKGQLKTCRTSVEKLGNSLERVFTLIDKTTELRPVEVSKELQREAKVLESYLEYKKLGLILY